MKNYCGTWSTKWSPRTAVYGSTERPTNTRSPSLIAGWNTSRSCSWSINEGSHPRGPERMLTLQHQIQHLQRSCLGRRAEVWLRNKVCVSVVIDGHGRPVRPNATTNHNEKGDLHEVKASAL